MTRELIERAREWISANVLNVAGSHHRADGASLLYDLDAHLSAPTSQPAHWTRCEFDGPPPKGFASWSDFVESPVKSGAYLRSVDHISQPDRKALADGLTPARLRELADGLMSRDGFVAPAAAALRALAAHPVQDHKALAEACKRQLTADSGDAYGFHEGAEVVSLEIALSIVDRLAAAHPVQEPAGDAPKGYVLADQAYDVQQLYADLSDAYEEAVAVDTVLGRPVVLRTKLRTMRDTIGRAVNGYIPVATPAAPAVPSPPGKKNGLLCDKPCVITGDCSGVCFPTALEEGE